MQPHCKVRAIIHKNLETTTLEHSAAIILLTFFSTVLHKLPLYFIITPLLSPFIPMK